MDPTLPKVQNVLCPNGDCICNAEKQEDREEVSIIYIRYDDTNKKFVYMCTHCDTVWKTDEK